LATRKQPLNNGNAAHLHRTHIVTMKTILRLACVLLIAGSALAQPGPDSAAPSDEQSLREQRRAELRSALQTQGQAAPAEEARRQLSPQEREELRQQLRQQPPGTRKGRP
jgi:hypothetical protein